LSMATFLGIEIGGTKLQVVSGNDAGQILQRCRYAVNPQNGAEEIRANIAAAIEQLKSHQPKSIGVGFGGPVDHIAGKIWASYHVSGWSDFALKQWLENISGIPAIVENDANVAALGESCLGAGKNFTNVFYVTIGSGVGGGLVIGNRIYHGALPGETEFGHIRLDKSGRTVQDSCSGWAINEKVKKIVAENPGSFLAGAAKKNPAAEAKTLAEGLEKRDPHSVKLFKETVDDLSFGLSHVVHLIHPEIVILGGGFALIGQSLRELVKTSMQHYLMDAFQPGPAIELSSLKEDAVPVGALILAAQNS
jgi:glucokinase